MRGEQMYWRCQGFIRKKHCCRIKSNWVWKIVGRAIFFARLLWNVSKSHIGKVLRGPLTQQIENWRPFPFRLYVISQAYLRCFVTLLLLPPCYGPQRPRWRLNRRPAPPASISWRLRRKGRLGRTPVHVYTNILPLLAKLYCENMNGRYC